MQRPSLFFHLPKHSHGIQPDHVREHTRTTCPCLFSTKTLQPDRVRFRLFHLTCQDGVSYELSNLRCASVRFESNGPVSKRDCVDRFSSMAHVSYSPSGERRNEVRYVRNLQGAHARSFGHCQVTVPPLYLVDCIPVHATWIAAAAPSPGFLHRAMRSSAICSAAHA
jgi:hypothetical protein